MLAPSIAATETKPVVTTLSDGRFVAVWTSYGSSNQQEVYAQGVSVEGQLSGTPVLINTASSNAEWEPDIAALPNSRYLVVFNDSGGAIPGFGSSIVGRIMNPDGTGGARFKIDQEIVEGEAFTFSGSQEDPSVAVFPDGSFVVVWTDYRVAENERDILVRRFDATGMPLGDVALANSTTDGY